MEAGHRETPLSIVEPSRGARTRRVAGLFRMQGAIDELELYIDQIEALETQGHAASVSAALLTDYANILIDQLEPLAAP